MREYFNNIIYGVQSFVTGLKVTWGHFINKKDLVATLQYPHEKWPIPERNIGFDHSEYNLIRSRLHVDIDDCIACMQCVKACPVDCIKIDAIKPSKDNEYDCGMTSNDTQKKMIVSRFTIDMSECMYCNLCVYPCPEECIYMVGGPNDRKHEIDYEFSQYNRDGMIFEFADATDDMIHSAGGEKWIERRDANDNKLSEGVGLMGFIPESSPSVSPEDLKESASIEEKPPPVDSASATEGELDIKAFNGITDKMTRGIAKKVFMAEKRAGKDTAGILAEVAQVLSDSGKITAEIQSIIDGLSALPQEVVASAVEAAGVAKAEGVAEVPRASEVKEFDIKDLNVIEDKMTRGTAKKAFLAAKRSGEDKVNAIRRALSDAKILDAVSEELLNSFAEATVEVSEAVKGTNEAELTEKVAVGTATVIKQEGNMSLFEITELNGIDDRMTRGMAKKIYTAGKRAEKSRIEIINDIRAGLTSAGKLDESIATMLAKLESDD